MQKRLLYLFASTVLVHLFGCVGEPSKLKEPQATPSQQKPMISIPTFSGSNAYEYLLKQVAFGPRNPNSKGHTECLDYLANTLGQFADEVQLQPFAAQGYGETLSLTNIIAKFNTMATTRVLLCAHWDTRPRAEQDTNKARRNEPILGANDGASGVAVLIELASLFKKQPPPIGVDIILFDGEDYGEEGDLPRYFFGSRYFATNKPADYNPRFGILLDMVGDKFLDIPRERHSQRLAPEVMNLVFSKAKELGITQFIDEPGDEVNDDHLQLNGVGIPTIDLIDFNYPDPTHRFWHTHQDTPENCSAQSLEAVGTVVTHVVYSQLP